MYRIINDVFTEDQKKVLHHYHRCRERNCSSLGTDEKHRLSSKKDKFQHEWLFEENVYCQKTGLRWLVFVEGEGMYCLICKKYKCTNQQNKSDVFNEKPSVRYKTTAINEHGQSRKHSAAISCKMMNRVSVFQKELDERQKVNDSVLFKVFYSIYWLAKEGIANKKAAGLLTLLEKLGVNDLKYFDHRSPASVREMFSTLGCAVKENVVTRAKTAGCFGLLVDDVSDISTMEQMITFIQFYDKDSSEVTVEFLSVDNLLEKHDSANAVAMFHTIQSNLQACTLSTDKLIGLAPDGASVMVGRKNGLGVVQSLNSPFFPPHIGAEPGRAKEESRITCMRMLRTPPFFPPKSGEKPYLEVFSRFGFWRNFLNDNIQATISAFRLIKNMSINPKSVEFHQCHAKPHSICFFSQYQG